MTRQQRFLLVCDASRGRGSGHVMRMITLGACLRGLGADVTLLAHDLPDALRDLAVLRGLRTSVRRSPQESSELADEIPQATYVAIIFDGYDFDHQVFRKLLDRGDQAVIIDDNGEHAEAPCTTIVNPNLHASAEMYVSNPGRPLILLGTQYALIRPEVREMVVPASTHRSGVVLSLGGTDVLGRRDEIEERLRRHRAWAVTSAKGLIGVSTTSAPEMARAMAQARVGLIAFGTTTWEALCLGLPIVGVVVADNQLRVAASLASAGLATSFDLRDTSDLTALVTELSELYDSEGALAKRSEHGRSLIDGKGAHRVARFLCDL